MINKVILVGNLGSTPTINYSAKGVAVTNFRLATHETRKNAEGESKDHTEWHSVVAFGRTAESCVQYLKKGRQVLVDGTIRTNSWTDKDDNTTKYRSEVIASRVQFLGGGKQDSDSSVNKELENRA